MADSLASGDARLCRHYFVLGRVQGVFYRASAEETARQLGLAGWVRNLSDGRVELVACGESRKLAALEKWLGRGPVGARVDQVNATDLELVDELTDFRIRY